MITNEQARRQRFRSIVNSSFNPPDNAESIVDYCINNNVCVMHARWELDGRKYICMCSPCTLYRGEKLI